jgi:hypothetical protein
VITVGAISSAIGLEGDVADLADDDERIAGEALQFVLEPSGVVHRAEAVHSLRRGRDDAGHGTATAPTPRGGSQNAFKHPSGQPTRT